ncbi:hypothetical protein BDV12DRAFT_200182 [Aspergillus spectabilis]
MNAQTFSFSNAPQTTPSNSLIHKASNTALCQCPPTLFSWRITGLCLECGLAMKSPEYTKMGDAGSLQTQVTLSQPTPKSNLVSQKPTLNLTQPLQKMTFNFDYQVPKKVTFALPLANATQLEDTVMGGTEEAERLAPQNAAKYGYLKEGSNVNPSLMASGATPKWDFPFVKSNNMF